jgi:protein-disulfide isomerase
MPPKLFPALTAALLFVTAGPAQNQKKSALDKATLEAYVRHLYVMDNRITVQVLDPKPSTELPGYMDVTVHASAGQQAQDFKFLVSRDGSKILQGSVYDVNNNPFKSDLDRLKNDGAPSFGTPGAPVVLVEFSDFQCPFCKDEATMLRANLPVSFPKEVRLYFREFPLENLHPWAKSAAIASRCIYHQSPSTYWEFHDWIFPHQAEITPENFKAKLMEWASVKSDLDPAKLNACYDTKATESEVKASQEMGHALAVEQTPTLFVNGRRIPGAITWDQLKSIIDYEIEYQKTAKNAGDDCGCDLKLNLPGQTPAKTAPLAPPKK